MHPTEPISSSCVAAFRLSVMFGLPQPFASPPTCHTALLLHCLHPWCHVPCRLASPPPPCTAHTLGPSFTSSPHCATLVLPHHPCTVLVPGRVARTTLDLPPRPLHSLRLSVSCDHCLSLAAPRPCAALAPLGRSPAHPCVPSSCTVCHSLDPSVRASLTAYLTQQPSLGSTRGARAARLPCAICVRCRAPHAPHHVYDAVALRHPAPTATRTRAPRSAWPRTRVRALLRVPMPPCTSHA
jgi:hypothetical protein